MSSKDLNWQKTACILCSENCGIEVVVDEDGRFTRIRGDKSHPATQGYICQKASRLDYYQNHADRLNQPLRRAADGSFEPISWDTAISEIAKKLAHLRDTHGGHSIAYMGGGGQGNHMGGIYGNALKGALKTRYHYSSIAQEKTGGFWVNGKLYGRQTCVPTNDVENADYIIFLGTNPWQSHGIPRARKLLQEIRKDPNRTMVVVDPWRTKTAEMADVHLAVKPGRDAFLFSAMIAIILQEGLENKEFIEAATVGMDELRAAFGSISVEAYCEFAGLDPEVVRQVTRDYAAADRATIRADLGLEHSLHSTLNDYLGKLLYLITGHFGRIGTNNLRPQFMPLIGHSGDMDTDEKVLRTRVTGTPEISKLFPPNVLPEEIDTDHPDRLRGVIVDSMNPVATGANTEAYRRAFRKLEILVVIDVAMSETAREADYILPASSQYEKWEATFFGMGMPSCHFHLRAPIVKPLAGTLPEPEIYRRLLLALGETPQSQPLLGATEQVDKMAPHLSDWDENFKAVAAPLLFSTQRLESRAADAAVRAGFSDEGKGLAASIFNEIATNRSGVEISRHEYKETFDFIKHPDHKIHLAIGKMLEQAAELRTEMESGALDDSNFPMILSAGARRSYNANTIVRNPDWRRDDREGALLIHPEDLKALGLSDGDDVVCESQTGSVTVTAAADDAAQPGFVNLPHGYGLTHTAEDGSKVQTGPLVNVLSATDHCDPIAKTPYHKTIPVSIRAATKEDRVAVGVAAATRSA